MANAVTYEWLRGQLASMQKADDSAKRDLLWVDSSHCLAVARDASSRVEVFLRGPALVATTKAVGNALEYDKWNNSQGGELPATRIVFPRGEHFDHVAALLCVELLANGVQRDAQEAFDSTEALIALAFAQDQVADQVIVGLVGELVLLTQILSRVPTTSSAEVLNSWAGSGRSARDFQFGQTGVEVKTTQSGVSTHHVQGVHQIEVGHSNSGGIETALYLLSLDLSWVDHDEYGQTLPDLVDTIVSQIGGTVERASLLSRIKQYGGDSAVGYDHARDRNRPRFQRRFFLRFERLYDMADDRLKLLRSGMLSELEHVEPSSVEFRIILPPHIRGDLNPITGWDAVIAKLLAAGDLPPTRTSGS